jgi:hypothetical protein
LKLACGKKPLFVAQSANEVLLTQFRQLLSGSMMLGLFMASNPNTAKPPDSSEQQSSELEDSTLCSAYMRVLSQTSVRADFLKVSKRHSELLESLGYGASRISIR